MKLMNPCQVFLVDFLRRNGGQASARECIEAGLAEGYTVDQVKSARLRTRNPRIATQKLSDRIDQGWSWHLMEVRS